MSFSCNSGRTNNNEAWLLSNHSSLPTKGNKSTEDENKLKLGNDQQPREGATAAAATETELPLDWTRLGKRKFNNNNVADDDKNQLDDTNWRCCGNKQCRHRAVTLLNNNINKNNNSKKPRQLRRCYTGRAMFCLLETDPTWFQGYFFVNDNSNKNKNKTPWGLLATRQAVDDCLACAEGGYRVIDLTVTQPGLHHHNKKKHVLEQVEWTGADMMEWNSPHVQLRTERLATNQKANVLAQQVFANLFRRIRDDIQKQQGEDDQNDVAKEEDMDDNNNKNDEPTDLFPDLAIVAGTMKLWLPIEESSDSLLYDVLFQDDDNDTPSTVYRN